MKNILLYGLQRSGTNFMETLLQKNYKIKVLNDNSKRNIPLQKHFRLYDNKTLIPEPQYQNDLTFNNFSEYLNSLDTVENIDGIIIVSKDPHSWLLSYRNWAKKCNWPKANYHYIEEYQEFYTQWLNFGKEDKRIVFIRYIDLLLNAEKQLEMLENLFGLKKPIHRRIFGGIQRIKRVGQSTTFNNNRRNYYINKKFLEEFDTEDLEIINAKINTDLLKRLEYTSC